MSSWYISKGLTRRRAQTLIYFDYGLRVKDIVALQELNSDTVYDQRKNWLSIGFSFLFDVHRRSADAPTSKYQNNFIFKDYTLEYSKSLLFHLSILFFSLLHRFARNRKCQLHKSDNEVLRV